MTTQTQKAAPAPAAEHDAHGFRRKMVGKVVKPNKNPAHAYGKRPGVAPKTVGGRQNKTVVVEVVSHTRDKLYGKYVRSRARYKAHDEKMNFSRATSSKSRSTPRCRATSASRSCAS